MSYPGNYHGLQIIAIPGQDVMPGVTTVSPLTSTSGRVLAFSADGQRAGWALRLRTGDHIKEITLEVIDNPSGHTLTVELQQLDGTGVIETNNGNGTSDITLANLDLLVTLNSVAYSVTATRSGVGGSDLITGTLHVTYDRPVVFQPPSAP